ncbi:MAG: hypothetical protein HC829_00575, partial [Bacteroidales bacterium]|nr:hypothetical protein [Bacteroidales bacterium]
TSLFLAGPQLSFLAVAAMILFAPFLRSQPIADPLDRLLGYVAFRRDIIAAIARRKNQECKNQG